MHATIFFNISGGSSMSEAHEHKGISAICDEKAQRFTAWNRDGLALTYADVTLQTEASEFFPHEVGISSKFTREVGLKVPIVSAAMDTVTEADMAIAMAKAGGIGVIHTKLSAEGQRDHVRRVKYHLSGFIKDPVTYQPEMSIGTIIDDRAMRGYGFHTFPIVNSRGQFEGLLTRTEFELCSDPSVPASEKMTKAIDVSSINHMVTVEEAHRLMQQSGKKTLPVVDTDGKLQGMYVWEDVDNIVRGNRGQFNLNSAGRLVVAAAVTTRNALERLDVFGHHLDVVVIDTSNGDGKAALQTVRDIKSTYPDLQIVSGNITSGRSAVLLAKAGVDGIKVGQGPGAICTTRQVTGYGTPQVTAVYNVTHALREAGFADIPVCADGGVTELGHFSKAIAAGAGSIMVGSMLAGTTEAPGDIIVLEDERRVKIYRGMGSKEAMEDSPDARARYSNDTSKVPLAQGVSGFKPYKGPVAPIIDQFEEALRTSFAGVGSGSVADHQANAVLWRQTNSGATEGAVHDLIVKN